MSLHKAVLAIALAACVAAPAARADHRHHGGGHGSVYWSIGIPFGYGYGYGPGYYGGPWGGPWIEPWPYERRIYIERERAQPELPAGPPPTAYWYYCDSAGAYYPYVETCAEPWRQVPAEPDTPSRSDRR